MRTDRYKNIRQRWSSAGKGIIVSFMQQQHAYSGQVLLRRVLQCLDPAKQNCVAHDTGMKLDYFRQHVRADGIAEDDEFVRVKPVTGYGTFDKS